MELEKQSLLVAFKNREDLMILKDKIKYSCFFSESIKDCLEIEGNNIDEIEKDIFALLLENNISVKSISAKNESLEEIFLREVRKNG